MKFRFVGPEKQQTLNASHIECFNKQGNLTILPGHQPDIFLLTPHSTITAFDQDGTSQAFAVEQAVLEIKRDEVTALVLI